MLVVVFTAVGVNNEYESISRGTGKALMTKEAQAVLRDKAALEAVFKEYGVWQTARRLGVGKSTVRRWLDRHGIPRGEQIRRPAPGYNRKLYVTSGEERGGYRWVRIPGERDRKEHRVVMEEYLGRPLQSVEVVHHIDGDKKNNALTNLWLCSSRQHRLAHASMETLVFTLLREGLVRFDTITGKYEFESR